MLFNATGIVPTAGQLYRPLTNVHQTPLDPANNLGYGLGRLVRAALDQLGSSWQRKGTLDVLSSRRSTIYQQRFQEWEKQCDKALGTLRINPHDPTALRKIEKLVHQYAVSPMSDEEAGLQQRGLRSLAGKIEQMTHPRLRQALDQVLPSAKSSAKRALQQSGYPASFDLTTLNGANGFAIPGIAANGYLGNSVSSAGDINGDGKADFVLGAPDVSSNVGEAYVIFGQASGWTASFNLATLNGANGFAIPGIAANGDLGSSVSTAGDINGDGNTDLVFGAEGVSSTTGEAYVIFGQASGWPASFNLATLNGVNGFAIPGIAASGRLGYSVSTAGDINGDGKDDLVLGAYYVSSGLGLGEAYVIFGQASGWTASFNLATLNGANGFAIPGIAANGHLGVSVSTAGDINGDGRDDLVLGAYSASSGLGEAYVIFGQASGWPTSFDLTTLNGTNGFAIPGIAANGELGNSVSSAGDINGDGKTDFVLGAYRASSETGEAYVIFGKASGWTASFNLTTLNGTNGFAIPGIASGGSFGYSVSTAGDINGDGKDDLVLGAWDVSLLTGEAYVIFGQASGWPASFNLATLNGANGFAIPGIVANGYLGYSVSTAGDINGDGKTDFVLGAYGVSSGVGEAYVIFGANASSSPTSSSNPSVLSSPPVPSLPTSQAPLSPVISSPSLVASTIAQNLSPVISSPSLVASTIAQNLSPVISSPSLVASTIAQNPTTLSPTSLMPPPSPANSATNGTTPSSLGTTIGIAVGVGALVLIGGLIGIVLFLRFKKKACFAEDLERSRRPRTLSTTLEEQPLPSSFFISPKNIVMKNRLAEGNFGSVYRGTYQNKEVAIKQLKGQLTPETEAKLFDEVKIMAQLRSPYVVTFYGVTKDQPYQIIMEYMEGGSLRDFLKKQSPEKTPWDTRLQISHDISQGLTYLHEQNIVHADLKSLNVLLDNKMNAKLADFGLASVKTENMDQFYQDASQVKGSLLWMAPELFNQGRHSFATDLYSLGVVLWEIARHRLPFQEKRWGAGEMIAQVTQGTREQFPEGTPEPYQALAKKCWDGNPSKRPSAEKAATILSELWKGKEKNEGYQEIAVEIKEPGYLTGTYEGKKPDYDAETKFGI